MFFEPHKQFKTRYL